MLTSTLNAAPKETPQLLTFPALYKSVKGCRITVLFTDKTSGTVVVADPKDNEYELGACCNSFKECTDKKEWAPLKPGESVTITQG